MKKLLTLAATLAAMYIEAGWAILTGMKVDGGKMALLAYLYGIRK